MFSPTEDDNREADEKLLAHENLLDDEGEEERDDEIQHPLPYRPRQTFGGHKVLLLLALSAISALFGALTGASIGLYIGTHRRTTNLDAICLEHTSQASPLTPTLPISWHTTRFNGSLLKENAFRQPPGPAVDAAWAGLGVHYHSIVVPAAEASRVGLRDDQVKVKGKYGGGFVANVEGLHQLHCLNLVRQSLYFNAEYYRARGEGAWANSEFVARKHITHCLDIVRQQLMCTIDVGVLGQVWFQPSLAQAPEAYVDFNTPHVCRDFEAVRKWAEERQIGAEVPEDFLEPPREGDRVFRTIP